MVQTAGIAEDWCVWRGASEGWVGPWTWSVVPGICLSRVIPFSLSPGLSGRVLRHLEPPFLLTFCDSRGYGCWLLNQTAVKPEIRKYDLGISPTSSWQILISKLRIQNEFTGRSSDNQLNFSVTQICCNLQNTVRGSKEKFEHQGMEAIRAKKKREVCELSTKNQLSMKFLQQLWVWLGGCTTKWDCSIWILKQRAGGNVWHFPASQEHTQRQEICLC